MKQFTGKTIDWIKTGRQLETLRRQNINLIKKVCAYCRSQENCSSYCPGGFKCETCTHDMDNLISRSELASAVAGWSESQIANWEGARSNIPLEDLYIYCDLCGVTLDDILIFEKEK